MPKYGRLLSLLILSSRMAWAAPQCPPPPVIQLPLGNCTIRTPGRSDVHSWGARVGVENATDLCVVPSTVLTSTFLTREDVCGGDNLVDNLGQRLTPEQCRSRRGGWIAKSFPEDPNGLSGLSEANPNWAILGNDLKAAAQATLKLFDQSVSMVVGLITGGQQSTASHLGLASNSVVLQTLKEKGLIAARSFGLDVGSQSVDYPRRGNLVLGGYDRGALAASSSWEYKVATEPLQKRDCPLQVKVTDITMRWASWDAEKRQTRFDDTTIVTRASNTLYCIEPYDNLFRLPSETADDVKDWFGKMANWSGGTVEPAKYSEKLVNLEPGLVYPKEAVPFNGSMRITIGDDLTVEIPFYELWRPLRGLDKTGDIVLDSDFNELQVYGSAAAGDAGVLGKAFLSQVYLFVDYEAKPPVFRLAPLTQEPTLPDAVSSASCPGGLNPSEKGLIAVGSVLGALLGAILGFFLYRYCCAKPRDSRRSGHEMTTTTAATPNNGHAPAGALHSGVEDTNTGQDGQGPLGAGSRRSSSSSDGYLAPHVGGTAP